MIQQRHFSTRHAVSTAGIGLFWVSNAKKLGRGAGGLRVSRGFELFELTARFEDLIKGWNHTVWNVLLALRLVESAQFLKAQLQNQSPPPSTTPSDCFALVSGRFGGVRLGFETDSMFFTLEGAAAQESCACRACGLGPWGTAEFEQ